MKRMAIHPLAICRLAIALALALPLAVPATAVEWTVDADGNWFDAGNWSAAPPNGSGAVANFNADLTADRTVTLDASATVGEIIFEDPTATHFSTIIQGNDPLTFAGGAVVRANRGDNNQINVNLNTGGQQLNVYAPTAASSVSISGQITGTGGLQKLNDAGTLELLGDNSGWSGTKVARVGRLGLGHANALGTGNTDFRAISFYAIGGDYIINNPLAWNTSQSTTFDGSNGNSLTFTGDGTLGGLTRNGPGDLTFSGNVSSGNITSTGDGVLSFAGTLSAGSATLNGNNIGGRIHLLGDNTGLTVSELRDGVHIGVGNDGALGNAAASVRVIRDVKFEALDGPRTIPNDMRLQVVSGGNAFRVMGDQDLTLTGVLSDFGSSSNAGRIVKSGSHTLTLTGENTYSNGTQIDAGVLRAGHAQALGTTGAIGVADGATLAIGSGVTFDQHSRITFDTGSALAGDGTYVVPSNWNVPSDFTLSPGASIGTLTVSMGTSVMTLASDSNLMIELDSSGASDLLQVVGSLDLAGTALTLSGDVKFDHWYTIAAASEGVSGELGDIDLAGLFGSPGLPETRIESNQLQINFSSIIPEPSSAVLLLLGIAVLRPRRLRQHAEGCSPSMS